MPETEPRADIELSYLQPLAEQLLDELAGLRAGEAGIEGDIDQHLDTATADQHPFLLHRGDPLGRALGSEHRQGVGLEGNHR